MNWKSRFKLTLKIRLVIIGLILAVAGWFLLRVVVFGGLGTKEFLQSNTLTWSFRIIIIGVPIILVIKREWLTRALEDTRFKGILYIYSMVSELLVGYGEALSYWLNMSIMSYHASQCLHVFTGETA